MGVCVCVTCVAYIIFKSGYYMPRNRNSCQRATMIYHHMKLSIYIYTYKCRIYIYIDCNISPLCPFKQGFIDSNFFPLDHLFIIFYFFFLWVFGYSTSVPHLLKPTVQVYIYTRTSNKSIERKK